MRETLLVCVVAIACGAGCGSVMSDVDASAGDDASPSIDAPPATGDAHGDAATLIGSVACGPEGGMCTIPDEYCCDLGSSGATCEASPPAGCATAYRCDGPEDCGGGSVCCFASGSQCESADTCADTGGARMCHSVADCMTGENCCDTDPGPVSGGGYGACRTDACPQ